MNAYSFGGPGHRLGRGNRLSRILDTRSNNGSNAGGISSVLANLLIGLEAGQDRRDGIAADKAFSKGMSAKPWTPPDEKVALGPTGSEGADKFITREEAMKTAAPAGGVEGALYSLSQLEDNPYAGRFSRKLSLDKMELDRKASEKSADRAYDQDTWSKRLDAQTERQKELTKFRLENTPKNETPETFGTPQAVQGPDGNPVMVQFGNRGTVRPVDGYQPVPKPPKEQGGPFAGTSMDAQANNILLTGDPSSPVYKAAYNHLAQPRVQFDPQTNQQITIKPDMSAYAPPASMGAQPGIQSVQGQPGTPTPMQEVGQATSPTATGQAAPQMPMPNNSGGVEISQVAGAQSIAPPELSSNQAPRIGPLGVPLADTDPLANLPPREQAKLSVDLRNKAVDAFTKSREQVDQARGVNERLGRFIELVDQGLDTGAQYKIPGAQTVMSALDDKVSEAGSIIDLMTPMMRQGMPGAASDRDVAMFRGATVGLDKPDQSNRNIAAGLMASRQNLIARDSFMQAYFDQNTHLQGADRAWQRYLDANPIFDPNAPEGAYQLNRGRKDWQTFFSDPQSQSAPQAATQADIVPSKPEDMDGAPVGATFTQNGMKFTKSAPGPGGDKWTVEAVTGDQSTVSGQTGLGVR